MRYCFILVQGFCPLKIEITQFADGFRLKNTHSMESIERFKMLENIKY